MKNFIFALFAFVVVASCASKIGSSSTKQEVITNTKWILVDSNISGSKIPTLNIEDKRIYGNAGCNNYFSDAAIDPNTSAFMVGNIGATKMACPDLKTEDSYLQLLEKVNKYKVNEGFLELYQDNLLLLKFKK